MVRKASSDLHLASSLPAVIRSPPTKSLFTITITGYPFMERQDNYHYHMTPTDTKARILQCTITTGHPSPERREYYHNHMTSIQRKAHHHYHRTSNQRKARNLSPPQDIIPEKGEKNSDYHRIHPEKGENTITITGHPSTERHEDNHYQPGTNNTT